MLVWPKRCKLAHAFLWESSYKRLKLAQLLGQRGVLLLTWRSDSMPRKAPQTVGALIVQSCRRSICSSYDSSTPLPSAALVSATVTWQARSVPVASQNVLSSLPRARRVLGWPKRCKLAHAFL